MNISASCVAWSVGFSLRFPEPDTFTHHLVFEFVSSYCVTSVNGISIHSCRSSKTTVLETPWCSGKPFIYVGHYIQSDSKLFSGFPWPILFKPETTK
jgi:hypothetical protein